MTERTAHYHKSGTLTARLELVYPADLKNVEGFVRRHADAVRSGFEAELSGAADAVFEAMRSRDRAYKYRPYTLRAEYTVRGERRSSEVDVSVTCVSGRRAVYTGTERHLFREKNGASFYRGRIAGKK